MSRTQTIQEALERRAAAQLIEDIEKWVHDLAFCSNKPQRVSFQDGTSKDIFDVLDGLRKSYQKVLLPVYIEREVAALLEAVDRVAELTS